MEEGLNAYAKLDIKQFNKIVGTRSKPENNISKIEKSIQKNNIKINNLVDKISMLSNAASNVLLKKIEELTSQNEEFKRELLFLKQEEINNQMTSPEEKFEKIKLFSNALKYADIDTKRELLHSITEEIYWDEDIKDINIVI